MKEFKNRDKDELVKELEQIEETLKNKINLIQNRMISRDDLFNFLITLSKRLNNLSDLVSFEYDP